MEGTLCAPCVVPLVGLPCWGWWGRGWACVRVLVRVLVFLHVLGGGGAFCVVFVGVYVVVCGLGQGSIWALRHVDLPI